MFGVAPFVGYKYAAPFGLTIELQAGVGASIEIPRPQDAVQSTAGLFPLGSFYVHAHTGIGWSF